MNRSRMLQGVLGGRKNYLLDIYSGAVGAYSLRYLSSSFVGNDVILVRRSSDGAEQGFTPTEITDGTLTSFCGSGDGFVKTWYDQSQSGYNLLQTTNPLQPKIVSSGSVNVKNQNPCIRFDGIDDRLRSAYLWNKDTDSFFSVLNIISNPARNIPLMISEGSNNRIFYVDNGRNDLNVVEIRDEPNIAEYTYNTNQALLEVVTGAVNSNIYKDGVNLKSYEKGSGISTDGVSVGAFHTGSVPSNCNHQELILFNQDISSNRTEIEANINEYYNVF